MIDISVLRGCVIFETFGKCGLYVVTFSFIDKSKSKMATMAILYGKDTDQKIKLTEIF